MSHATVFYALVRVVAPLLSSNEGWGFLSQPLWPPSDYTQLTTTTPMAGRKRAAEDSPETATRASPRRGAKAAKVSSDGESGSPKATVSKKPASSAGKKAATSAPKVRTI